MPEVVTDYTDVDAGLEQGDGTTVAEDVGRDPTVKERRPRSRRALHVFLDDVGRAIARQRSAMSVLKDLGIGVSVKWNLP